MDHAKDGRALHRTETHLAGFQGSAQDEELTVRITLNSNKIVIKILEQKRKIEVFKDETLNLGLFYVRITNSTSILHHNVVFVHIRQICVEHQIPRLLKFGEGVLLALLITSSQFIFHSNAVFYLVYLVRNSSTYFKA